MARALDPLAEVLDGATGDYGVSGDAMRWSPELAADPASSPMPQLFPALALAAAPARAPAPLTRRSLPPVESERTE